MDINESARLYLTNYHVLEETRNEVNRFLQDIAVQFTAIVEEHIQRQNHPFIGFKTYVQKDGGFVQVYFYSEKPIPALEHLGDWKFMIEYRDAMRTRSLKEPTQCVISGVTPQNRSRQADEIRRMARLHKSADPYSNTEIDLLETSVEDVVNRIAKAMIDRHDDFIQLLEALIEEGKAGG